MHALDLPTIDDLVLVLLVHQGSSKSQRGEIPWPDRFGGVYSETSEDASGAQAIQLIRESDEDAETILRPFLAEECGHTKVQ